MQPVAAAGDIARTWQHLDRGMLALSPIDHGFCLPEALEPPYFEWLHWPQVQRAAHCVPLAADRGAHVAMCQRPVTGHVATQTYCLSHEGPSHLQSSIAAARSRQRPDNIGCAEQAMLPFSREELDYIARLDVEADCQLLRRELPWLREAALRTLTISTLVLQVGAAACPSHACQHHAACGIRTLGVHRHAWQLPVLLKHVPCRVVITPLVVEASLWSPCHPRAPRPARMVPRCCCHPCAS